MDNIIFTVEIQSAVALAITIPILIISGIGLLIFKIIGKRRMGNESNNR